MLKLLVDKPRESPLRLLCLGAHSDDIEIGCGGTLLRLIEDRPNTEVYWVVFSSGADREKEARHSAGLFLTGATNPTVVVKDFRGSFFPYEGAQIKDYFEELKAAFRPDVIFTHQRDDFHQDHRTLNELTWNTFRNHWILEYEIFKYDGDLGRPNVFMHLSAELCEAKVKHLMDCFATQRDKAWFTEDTFYSMMRLRGAESNSPSRYAEAFYCRKLVLG